MNAVVSRWILKYRLVAMAGIAFPNRFWYNKTTVDCNYQQKSKRPPADTNLYFFISQMGYPPPI